MLDLEDSQIFPIPPRIKSTYQDFKFLAETSTYKVYEAEARDSKANHTIRVLDRSKELVKNNFALTASFFVQELLHLQKGHPGSVLTNTFEISEDGERLACATLRYLPLSCQINEIMEVINLKDPQMIEKLISDSLFDIEFLYKDLQIRKVIDVLGPESLCFMEEKDIFFLSNWAKVLERVPDDKPLSLSLNNLHGDKLSSKDIPEEINGVALAVLKLNKIDVTDLDVLRKMKNPKYYNLGVKTLLQEHFSDSKKLKDLLERMLSLDPQSLPNLEELRIAETDAYVSATAGLEEAKTTKGEGLTKNASSLKKNTEVTSLTPPELLAWSSYKDNKISIMNLETKLRHASFDGVKIKDTGNSWTHLKEIPNSGLLVSVHHSAYASVNMEIFDIAEAENPKKIYSFGELSGSPGYGDVTYNSRRSILGAVSFGNSYHIFNVDTNASNPADIVTFNRKSKWPSLYTTSRQNQISGLDFNPLGEAVAILDLHGSLLISDVYKDDEGFHINFGAKQDPWGRCRWSTNSGEALVYVKYDLSKINILDVEKKALALTIPVQLGNSATIYWIDVCQSNGNLQASCGQDKCIKIFDKRESKIVKNFEGFHLDDVRCVRWSPDGDMLVSASDDKTVKLFDFKTGKVIHTGKTPDGSTT